MRFYQTQHPFYCGVDLHTKTLHVCIVDQAGTVLVHRNLPASPELFLQTLAPYRDQGVAVALSSAQSEETVAQERARRITHIGAGEPRRLTEPSTGERT